MKTLNANEVQQVSGGDRESQEQLEEFLRNMEDYFRRRRDYVPYRDFP
jgi:deoxyribodipyrimidine photolyase